MRSMIFTIFFIMIVTVNSCTDIIDTDKNIIKKVQLQLIDSNLIERQNIIPVRATANTDSGMGNVKTEYVYGSDSASIVSYRKSSVLNFILFKNNLDSQYIKITSVKSTKGYFRPVYFPEKYNYNNGEEPQYPYYLNPGQIDMNNALIPLTELMGMGRNDDYIIINNNPALKYHIIINLE